MRGICASDGAYLEILPDMRCNHQGEPYKIYLDVKKPGLHTIIFSMREDGFELDKWMMSKKRDILKLQDPSLGPDESMLRKMKLSLCCFHLSLKNPCAKYVRGFFLIKNGIL